jgi:cell wall-associated NlpC family hydrolase
MVRLRTIVALIAALTGCASNSSPEPMRTGVAPNPRYHPPDPTRPTANPTTPAIVGESAWQSEAAKWIGAPYRTGGSNREGMDSMGLVRKMYQNVARIDLPRDLDELSRTGFAIPRDQLRPGDIIFLGGNKITQAAIYIGQGRIVQAVQPFGVTYADLTTPQVTNSYRTARRILR